MKMRNRLIAVFLMLALVLTSVIPNTSVFADDVNSDSKDPTTGHKTGNNDWKYYPYTGGVRISIYWVPALQGEKYEDISANFNKPSEVRQLGVTTDFMGYGVSPNYTVSYHSTKSVYRYMKDVTVYPTDSEAIKTQKQKNQLKYGIDTSKYSPVTLSKTQSAGMPTNLEKASADAYVEWLTGKPVGDKYDKERDYSLIATIAHKSGVGSWFTAKTFKEGKYKDDEGSWQDGCYKVLFEPTISCVLNGAGTQATFRDLLAWGQTYGFLSKVAGMKPMISCVGDTACLAYNDDALGMKALGNYSIAGTSAANMQKAITKGGTLFQRSGVSAIEPQRTNPPEAQNGIKVVKTYSALVRNADGTVSYEPVEGYDTEVVGYATEKSVQSFIDKELSKVAKGDGNNDTYLNDLMTSPIDLTVDELERETSYFFCFNLGLINGGDYLIVYVRLA